MNPREEFFNQRTGKIARLDFALRHTVNAMIRDNRPYAEIMQFLGEKGITGINDQNLTNWKQGGHQDWLRQQDRLADMERKREFAFEIAKENEGSKIHEAGLNLAASQIFEMLQDFDPAVMKEMLAEDPENYSKIVTALARISKEALGFERFKQLVSEQKHKIEQALNLAKSKGGLTPDTLKQIEEAAGML